MLGGSHSTEDIRPLSACLALEVLEISHCPLVTSLAPLSSLTKLEELYCLLSPGHYTSGQEGGLAIDPSDKKKWGTM